MFLITPDQYVTLCIIKLDKLIHTRKIGTILYQTVVTNRLEN